MEAQKDNDQSTIDSAEYNPIESLTLPKMGTFTPRGLVLVVGPNSSGKTQFLRDIDYAVNGEARNLVVCEAITRSLPPDLDAFVNDLIKKGYFRWVKDAANDGLQHIKPQYGIGQGHGGVMRPDQPRQFYEESKAKLTSGQSMSEVIFFRAFRHCISTALFLERRLSLTEPTRRYDPDHGLARSDLQALFLDQTAQRALSEEVQRTFSIGLWLDSTGNDLCLRVDQTGAVPSADERLQPSAMEKYHLIGIEGDGVRSYVGMCVAALLGRCPILLIDEPELGLHPPQAHAIGRFIGRFGGPGHRTTFVATHSSHVLRGALETGKRMTILRLTRRRNEFQGRLIDEQKVVDSIRNPRSRAEAVLDGIFSKGVVLVEGEGDREEYQAASDIVENYPAREVHFVPVGGHPGFVEPLRFYRLLDIPTAVIADLDAVCDTDRIVALSKELVPSPVDIQASISKLRDLAKQIKALPPPITPDHAKNRLKQLSEMSWNWNGGDDNVLRRNLSELSNQLKRIQKLKEGGIGAYEDHHEIHALLQAVTADFAKIGLFFVPVGELEDWVRHLMDDVPKASLSKTDRAAIAADRIRAATNKVEDIWAFVRGVFDFLQGPDE